MCVVLPHVLYASRRLPGYVITTNRATHEEGHEAQVFFFSYNNVIQTGVVTQQGHNTGGLFFVLLVYVVATSRGRARGRSRAISFLVWSLPYYYGEEQAAVAGPRRPSTITCGHFSIAHCLYGKTCKMMFLKRSCRDARCIHHKSRANEI